MDRSKIFVQTSEDNKFGHAQDLVMDRFSHVQPSIKQDMTSKKDAFFFEKSPPSLLMHLVNKITNVKRHSKNQTCLPV